MMRPLRLAGRFLMVVAAVATTSAAPAHTSVLDYSVSLRVFGTVGTYRNRIEADGSSVTVRSTLRVRVTLLGVVLHREDATRLERWQDGRLVFFDGITITNGTPVHIHGEAQGDGFLIDRPQGNLLAPGDLYPSNPWSAAFTSARHILHVTTGDVEDATAVAGETTEVSAAGRAVAARAWHVDTRLTHAVVWLDAAGVPILMQVAAHGHTVYLRLQGEAEE